MTASARSRETGDKVALSRVRQREDIVDVGRPTQMVDMPVRCLVGRQMSPQPGPEATGAVGAAAVEIAPGRQSRTVQPGNRQRRGASQAQRQDIGAAGRRQAVGMDSYSVFFPVLRTVTVSPASTNDTLPLLPL